MSVETFVTGRTVTILCKPVAFWHASQVVLVKKFACVTLFAETTKPVFADGGDALSFAWMRGQRFWRLEVLGRGCRVTQWAVERAEGAACGGEEESADLVIWRDVSRGRIVGERRGPLSSLMLSSDLMYVSAGKEIWWS